MYLVLILPPVLIFALARRLAMALAAGARTTWHLLTQDPGRPAYQKAGWLQLAAHLLLVPVLVATLYVSRDHPWLEYGASALLGIAVVALLPMRPLAAAIQALARARARVSTHVADHVEIYVLSTTVAVIALGLYALIEHINADLWYEEQIAREGRRRLQSQLAEQVLALRAELAALKAAGTAPDQ